MNPPPPPGPLEVVVDSGAADWWVILAGLGPLAVLIAALLAFYINWRTLAQRTSADKTALDQKRDADEQSLRQQTEADSRAEWWRRTQWALDRALDQDQGTKALGLATLNVLAGSELARTEELELFDAAWEYVPGGDDSDWTVSAGSSEHKDVQARPNAASAPDGKVTPADYRVQVAAARLRVTLDERLGRVTPPQTTALAKELN
ncbi:hypothetical protein [Pseudarthrobacter cellobiosi]|uniref:hypothetical protein n=1 Tax=Pseudarthrobacter cellobiosi TaxID=2953654 RepID=UPI00208EE1ED|nr:hypothetical protein [Pseudarthrobacter sp. HLT1-5]MCO4255717.1 hypothetical protein [Pseudarthrobacter sp. HLT1-5]